MEGKPVKVGVWHGDDVYMSNTTENDIAPENVPKAARLLMDDIYLRLDDQVSVAELRAHRRDLRQKKREKAAKGGHDG